MKTTATERWVLVLSSIASLMVALDVLVVSTALGAIRHLFRDGPDRFDVRLTIEFPRATAPHMIRAHRWHLACEFSNWIEAANE